MCHREERSDVVISVIKSQIAAVAKDAPYPAGTMSQ
jgi:hypothetical protein